MATKKGGYIILDFKKKIISENATDKTQLDEDYYSRIVNTKGKSVIIINIDDDDYLNPDSIYNCTAIKFGYDEVVLVLRDADIVSPRLHIKKDNQAYFETIEP